MAKNNGKKTKAGKKAGGKGAEALAAAAEGKRAAARAQTIKVLASENPKRPGTAAFKLFVLYKSGMTVQDFLDAGGTMGAVRWDEKHKIIELK